MKVKTVGICAGCLKLRKTVGTCSCKGCICWRRSGWNMDVVQEVIDSKYVPPSFKFTDPKKKDFLLLRVRARRLLRIGEVHKGGL